MPDVPRPRGAPDDDPHLPRSYHRGKKVRRDPRRVGGSPHRGDPVDYPSSCAVWALVPLALTVATAWAAVATVLGKVWP